MKRKIDMPLVDLSADRNRHSVVAAGTESVYQGHCDTVLLPDGKTMFAAWCLGHARWIGPIAKSTDAGLTWSKPLSVPENWHKTSNTPALHRLVAPDGTARLFCFGGGLDWSRKGSPPYPMHQAYSEDDGNTWTPMAPNGVEGEVPPKTIHAFDEGERLVMWSDLPGYVVQSESLDGGLTWSASRRILRVPSRWSQPCVIRSADGKTLLMLLREQSGKYQSLFSVSRDGAKTWSTPRELPADLTGHRHVARLTPDGRLVVAFRDVAKSSSTYGHYVAWVGRFEDILTGKSGDYRVKLFHNALCNTSDKPGRGNVDCGYSDLELLPDGTIVATTYLKYAEGPEKHSVVNTRFALAETDALAGTQASVRFESSTLSVQMIPANTSSVPINPNNACEFGVEGPAPHNLPDVKLAVNVVRRSSEELPVFLKATRDLGASFFVCQFTPPQNTKKANARAWIGTEGTRENVRRFAAACNEAGLSFFINQEITNYSEPGEFLDQQGDDMLAHPDRSHRWDITGDLLDSLVALPEFRGVMYDEAAHAQMWTKRKRRYFAVTRDMDLAGAYQAVLASARTVADNYKKSGAIMLTEHVWPGMFHTFARAGITACPKFLKEGRDPIWAALAIGAAKQYGTGFWVTPDLWGRKGFPGHPPEELRCSLLFAYWMGAEKIFVENIYADFIKNPTGLLERRVKHDGRVEYVPSEYGRVYRWFVKEYVPKHPRPHTFRDVEPDIIIVRFPDAYWGQRHSWINESLYGADVQAGPESIAWVNIWHLLTHGHTSKKGISFHNKGWNVPHDFFCPLNNVVVYDHRVDRKTLSQPKLIFLTGVSVSDETRRAIRDCVKKGATCIALGSLAPKDILSKGIVVRDGLGKWVITDDFTDRKTIAAATPYLGKPDEIRYRFGERVLRVRRGKDGNEIRITLENESR